MNMLHSCYKIVTFLLIFGKNFFEFFRWVNLESRRGRTQFMPIFRHTIPPPVTLNGDPDVSGAPFMLPSLLDDHGVSLLHFYDEAPLTLVGYYPFPDISFYPKDYQNRSVSICSLLLPFPFLSSCEFH